MKVVEYATQLSVVEVEAAYAELYEEQPAPGNIAEWSRRVAAAVGVRQPDFKVLLRNVTQVGQTFVDVSGLGPRAELAQYYLEAGLPVPSEPVCSMSFTPWEEWRELEVVDRTTPQQTPAQVAAHLYYEMTWFGFPEQTEVKRDELMDTMEEVKRGLGVVTPFDPADYADDHN
jgi:hypothetical protein